jgi:ribosomal-protein-alanine N-acetyltransferase
MRTHLEVTTPEHQAMFKDWLQQDRLATMTCRPIVDGQVIAPDSTVTAYSFFIDEEEEPVGKFAYFTVNTRNRSAEFGYRIHPARRGQGWGRQMLQTGLNHLFQTTDLNKLYCQTAAFNTASVRLVEKLGLHRDGTLRQHHELDGHFYDDYVYSLLRQEWQSRPWSEP